MTKKQFVVIGMGRFGCSVCETLFESGAEVLALDVNEDRINEAMEFSTHAVCANAMDEDVLNELGISDFDVAVVTIGSDIKASGMITMLLKEMGVPMVIAKASDEIHGRMLQKLGADKVIYPERDMGRRIAHNLSVANIMDFIEVSPDYSLAEIRPMDKWVGKTLGQLGMRARYGINVLAIKRADSINAEPTADTVISEDDVLLVISAQETLNRLDR